MSRRVRIGIAARLGALLAFFALLAAGAAGWQAYTTSRDLLLEHAQASLQAAAQVLGRNLRLSLGQAEQTVALLARSPVAARALRAARDTERRAAQDTVAEFFEATLATHPAFVQVRLIAAGEFGLEVVRIDRQATGPVRIEGAALQEKGHLPYVFETLQRRPGEIQLSRIGLNREDGAHLGSGRPTLRIGSPIGDGEGHAVGLVVVDIDLDRHFELLRADLPARMQAYLTNERGDFLVHPDAARTFGFDRGRRFVLQDGLAVATPLFDGTRNAIVAQGVIDGDDAAPVLAAFARLGLGPEANGRFLVLGLAQPLQDVLARTRELGTSAWRMVLGFSAVAVALAMLLARAVTGPLKAMAQAAGELAEGRAVEALPVQRRDEIGLLARALETMRQRIELQMVELRDSHDAASHLALHDPLTGLPNRRLFMKMLESAIAGAKRRGQMFALLFVDLDEFKPINDRHGHAVGDAVLQAVAAMLRTSVREVDCVARLAGDEFVILAGGFDRADQADTIARKVHEALQMPLPVPGRDIAIRASIGIALYPQDGTTADELLVHADAAMYAAKRTGRNAWRYFGAPPPSTAMPDVASAFDEEAERD